MKKWIGGLFLLTLGLMILFNSCQDNNPYQLYRINQTRCQKCHVCVPKCGFGAITYTLDTIKTDPIGDPILDPITGDPVYKTKATVKIDPKKCVGCGECFRACPYHAIYGGGKFDGSTGATRTTGEDEEGDD